MLNGTPRPGQGARPWESVELGSGWEEGKAAFASMAQGLTRGQAALAAGPAGPQVHSAALAQEKSDKERWQHLADLADFALAMKDTLTNINNQSFNNFMLRIGRGHAAPRAVGGRPAALLV